MHILLWKLWENMSQSSKSTIKRSFLGILGASVLINAVERFTKVHVPNGVVIVSAVVAAWVSVRISSPSRKSQQQQQPERQGEL